ncbi:hypothetical protein MPLSOD_100324 [Mesorhizobium sp. SOD10]|nr:hypothetical protein MPLSOD_100324 [Mesorhizobium sp. SOD10]
MKFTGIFALYPLMSFHSAFHQAVFNAAISYYQTSRTLVARSFRSNPVPRISVRAERASQEIKDHLFPDKMFFRTGDWLLLFETDISYPGRKEFWTDETDDSRKYSDDEVEAFWRSVIPSFLDTDIQTYLMAVDLAFPGGLQTVGNAWKSDGITHHYSSWYLSMLGESIDFMVEQGFVPRTLPPERVVQWVVAQNGIIDGYSDTTASRALNYFTRLYTRQFRNDEISDLVWAVAAIEALLVEAGRSSVGQLKNKLDALFKGHSNAEWLRKSVEKMYGYRSNMVHGNRQIRSVFREDEDENPRRADEGYDDSPLEFS